MYLVSRGTASMLDAVQDGTGKQWVLVPEQIRPDVFNTVVHKPIVIEMIHGGLVRLLLSRDRPMNQILRSRQTNLVPSSPCIGLAFVSARIN